MNTDAVEIDAVFGPGRADATLEERALHSPCTFVRSQLQIAFDNERANGHRLSASEALRTFGWGILKKVGDDGSCPLIVAPDEPAQSLRKRRETIGLTIKQLARQAGVTEDTARRAETIGAVSHVFDLERLGQALALDESVLGHMVGAHADHRLGVRLRESSRSGDGKRFTSIDVLALAEAAWVIARFDWLALQDASSPDGANRFTAHRDYRYPAWERGYELAAETRKRLDIGSDEPISSLKSLSEDRLGIPVIQQVLSDKFAGATLANGSSRGIVINERGMNQNVWVRRMTLAHEICHLLWDADEKLERLRVDIYDDLERPYRLATDVVEMRANAFAVSFLAPPFGVRQIVTDTNDKAEAVALVMTTYGISATAAKHHIRNVCGVVVDLPAHRFPIPSDDWIARENLAVDFFRPEATPISRRGRFALLVIQALESHRISLDSAAMFLKASPADVVANKAAILAMAPRPESR